MRLSSVFAALVCAACGFAQPQLAIKSYPITPPLGGSNNLLGQIVNGSDGAMWFTGNQATSIGRITTAGVVTEFPLPLGFKQIAGVMTEGPDGALWFPMLLGSTLDIARMTTDGTVTPFTIDTTGQVGVNGITVGRDGAIWLSESFGTIFSTLTARLGRMTTAGVHTVISVSDPSFSLGPLVTGPDGNFWTTGFSGNNLTIFRVTPTGVETRFDASAYGSRAGFMIAGPDGALWLTVQHGGSSTDVIRVATNGTITNFFGTPLIPNSVSTGYMARGPDGAFWFGTVGRMTRITTSGVFTPYFVNGTAAGMTLGPDGGMWFVDSQNGAIARFDVSPSVTSALPHFAAQDIWTTGVFAVNTGNAPANYSVSFYDDNGNPIVLPFSSGATAKLSGSLPASGSTYIEAGNSQNGLISGWGQITADAPIAIQSLFRENSSGLYYEAAVPSNIGSEEFVIPFDATTFAATGDPFYTGFAIANLNSNTLATVTCTARDPSGNTIPNAFTAATGPPTLNPLGHWAGYLFPALTGKRGTIDCNANLAVAATALRFIGTNAFSSLPVIDKKLASSLIPGVALPHFAAQDIWTTGIFAVNTNAAAANFSIAFYDDNGNPIALPFSGGATNTLSGSLAAQGSAYFEASNPAAGLISGWGAITADQGVVIQALFRENASGKYFEAAVPASTGSGEFEIPFDATTFSATGDQFFTGFAIANLDSSNSATITCTARDNTGAVIPNAFTAATGPPQLHPLGHWAGYLFPALAGKRGTIDCASTTVVAATALRFIGTNAFSSLPVITK